MNKEFELKKYRDLVTVTLDYYIASLAINNEIKDEYLRLKIQSEEYYSKGNLSTLKKWFKDLTSDFIEERDFHFNDYLRKTTNYDINIFESYFKRIENMLKAGIIKTDNQFNELKNYIDYLIQSNNSNQNLIENINKILLDFELKKLNSNISKK